MRTGRCADFDEAAVAVGERRTQLSSSPTRWGSRSRRRAPTRGVPGRSSGSSTRRTTAATTRSCATSSGATTASACTSTSRSRAPTAPSPSAMRSATSSRSCSRSRRARPSSRESTRASTRSGRRSSRACFRAAASPTRTTAGTVSSATCAGSTTRARSTSTRRCGGACDRTSPFPTIEIRICDAQPDLAEARSLAALCYALTIRIAAALDEGEPLPNHPQRLIEENFWRAIRYGLSGELIDLESGDVRPARAQLERLLEWVLPAAEQIGAALAPRNPAANAAERQIARRAEGATLEEIYAEQVGPGNRSWLRKSRSRRRGGVLERPRRSWRSSRSRMCSCRRFFTVSSLGYRRLGDEEKDLEQAKLAIEALRALVPVLEGSVPEEALRDFGQVVANLQLAYARRRRRDRNLRRFGLLLVPRGRRGGRARHALRQAVRAVRGRRDRGAAGRLPAAARREARAAAAPRSPTAPTSGR